MLTKLQGKSNQNNKDCLKRLFHLLKCVIHLINAESLL